MMWHAPLITYTAFSQMLFLHRDVSSNNVLASRQGDCWRAKLSDFGSAEFEVKVKHIGDVQMPDVRMRRCQIWKTAP